MTTAAAPPNPYNLLLLMKIDENRFSVLNSLQIPKMEIDLLFFKQTKYIYNMNNGNLSVCALAISIHGSMFKCDGGSSGNNYNFLNSRLFEPFAMN